MKKQNYFIEKFNAVDEQHNSFNNQDLYGNAGDNWAEFSNQDLYAEGGDVEPDAEPYTISLYNSTNTAISDVAFLDAIQSIGTTNDGVTAGITPTYDIPGTTYATFLKFLQTQAVWIGKVYIESATAAQLTKAISIETTNVRGKSASEVYSPKKNPYENITTAMVLDKRFILNGWTKLTIASIAAGATVTYSFYAMKETSSTALLTGKPANKFANPQLVGMKILGK